MRRSVWINWENTERQQIISTRRGNTAKGNPAILGSKILNDHSPVKMRRFIINELHRIIRGYHMTICSFGRM